MIVNLLDHVGCEYLYFKEIFEIVSRQFDDNINVIIGIYPWHKNEVLSFINPEKKNVFVSLSEEITGTYISNEDRNKFDIVFRTYNNQQTFDNKKTFAIPCGWISKIDMSWHKDILKKQTIKPLKDRTYDLFFSGQRTQERQILFDSAQKLEGNNILNLTNGFACGLKLNDYFDKLRNSKIALVPKGATIFESFRFFDAYYSNCVVIITKELKEKYNGIWYYENCPAVVVDDWTCLSNELINSIINDIEQYDIKNRDYFNNKISIEAVAKYISTIIRNI